MMRHIERSARPNLGEQKPAWHWEWIRPHRDGVTMWHRNDNEKQRGHVAARKIGIILVVVFDVFANGWPVRVVSLLASYVRSYR